MPLGVGYVARREVYMGFAHTQHPKGALMQTVVCVLKRLIPPARLSVLADAAGGQAGRWNQAVVWLYRPPR